MSRRYTGNFIAGGNPQIPTLASNNGVFDVRDVQSAVRRDSWQEPDGYFEIQRSLRFRSSAGAYLSRIPSTSSNRNTFTLSMWAKQTNQGTQLFGVTSGSGTSDTQENNRLSLEFSNTFNFYEFTNSSFVAQKYSLPITRDINAWYHLVAAIDYTQSNPDNRIKLYVNGVQVTAYSATTTPSQNLTSYMNGSGNNHTVGGQIKRYNNFYEGYLTEFHCIDGQQLDPSFFGYFDPLTNIWQPKRYTGSYGVNGFYLPFNDNSSLVGLGENYGVANNRLQYSASPGSTGWANNGSTLATGQTDPFGGTSAVRLTTTNNDPYVWQGGLATVAGQRYNLSVWAKGGATAIGKYIQLNFYDGSVWNPGFGNNFFNLPQALTGEWQRFDWTFTSTATSANSGIFRIELVDGGAAVGDIIFLYGAQFTATPVVLPYNNVAATTLPATNWTTNNISLTAGVTYDSMVDSPVNLFTTNTDTGGVISGNYATWSSQVAANFNNSGGMGSTIITFSDGNLVANNSANTGFAPRMVTYSTIGFTTGKWYIEVTNMSNMNIGIAKGPIVTGTGNGIDSCVQYGEGGTFFAGNGASGTQFGTPQSVTTSDIVGVAFDADIGTITFYKNNVQMGGFTGITASSSIYEPTRPWFFYRSPGSSASNASITANFGQRPFTYTPPAGFRSLNTTNLQILGSSVLGRAAFRPFLWMDSTLYGGNSSSNSVTNSGFQPDLIWAKTRNVNNWNGLWDSSRGGNALIYSNSTDPESDATNLNIVTNPSGFSLNGNNSSFNGNNSHVAWQWRASSTSTTNTAGTITTQVRTSTDAGFSIIRYTGNGTENATIGHGLGVTPCLSIIKSRTTAAASWPVWTYLSTQSSGNVFTSSTINIGSKTGGVLSLNLTHAFGVTYGMDTQTNGSGTPYVAYCFAEVPGYSKFGVYWGNGNTDGPVVFTGFRPAWILIKNTSSAEQWAIIDNKRYAYNDNTAHILFANANSTEDLNPDFHEVDFLSNGFKLRGAAQALVNSAQDRFIYMAFAESPFALNNRAR